MRRMSIVTVMILSLALRAVAQGNEHMVTIGSANVTAYAPLSAVSGKYYKLDLEIPPVGSAATLQTAYLEFYVDAQSFVRGEFHWFDEDSVEHVGYKAATPVLEVFLLKSPIEGAVETSQLDVTTLARRPVLVGLDRRVVIDIAPIVHSFLEDPSRNRGIVVGSFLGSQEGDFTLKGGVFRDGSIAKVRLEFAPRK